MKLLTIPTILALLGNSSVNAAEVRMAAKDGITDRYIVTMKKNATVSPKTFLKKNLGPSAAKDSSTLVYESVNGFAANMSLKEAKRIAKSSEVYSVEQDGIVYAYTETDRWGLDRIDQEDLPLDDNFDAPNDGEGVTAYIVDTGIQLDHPDFGDRASQAADYTDGNLGEGDCNGHGTHVAGTVGGTVSGVAKKVTLKDVRVLDCAGSGTWSAVIGGVDWIATNHDRARDGPATVNMSLGGGAQSALNTAVTNLVTKGITVVVAAGNEDDNACSYSPASADKVLTVGSTTDSDARSYFSNYGSCVDIFAPGSDINSAWIDSGWNKISGTSMASPHVCGVTALYLSENNDLSPAQIETKLLNNAVDNKVTDPGTDSPNKLLNIGTFSPTASPTTSSPTVTRAPTATCFDFKVIIKTDAYPGETSWELINKDTNQKITSRNEAYYTNLGEYTIHTVEECIVPQCMKFTVSDSYGDGLESGSYVETYYNDVQVLDESSGAEWYSKSVEFGCSETPTVSPIETPTKSPTETPTKSPTETPTKSPTETPTKSPTETPTKSSTAKPTTQDTCPEGQSMLIVEVQGDSKSKGQNKYTVAQRKGDRNAKSFKKVINVAQGKIGNNKLHVTKKCVLNNKCFRFELFDSGKDGICCDKGMGYYRVTLDGHEMSRSNFQYGKVARFFFSDVNSEVC